MKFFAVFFLFFAIISATVTVEEEVLVLDVSNFDEVIQNEEFLLVEFYAPWCGHCQKLAPEYAKAATALKAANSPVKLAKVNAVDNRELGDRFDIQGFPTLIWFRNGQRKEYTGGRSADDLIKWVTKKSGPATNKANNEQDLTQFLAAQKVTVVGYFASEQSEEAQNYANLAGNLDDFPFVVVPDRALLEKYSVPENDNVVVLVTDFDGAKVYSGDFSVANLQKFIAQESRPSVLEYKAENQKAIFGQQDAFISFFFLDLNNEEHQALLQSYTEAAKQFKEIVFVYLDVNQQTVQRLYNFFRITANDVPYVRAFQLDKLPTKYALDQNDWKGSVQKLLDGTLEATFASAEVEEYPGTGVRILVGKDHDSVLAEPHDIFVEYYAPWCGHCKSLAPVWDELAKFFDDIETVTIAKMDATANEVASVQVKGFPTLHFFPAGEDKIPYEGERTLGALIAFVLDNSKTLSENQVQQLIEKAGEQSIELPEPSEEEEEEGDAQEGDNAEGEEAEEDEEAEGDEEEEEDSGKDEL